MSQLAHDHSADDITARNWNGNADLLDANGNVITSVSAELWQHVQDGRGIQWGGRIEAPAHAEPPHLPTAEYTYTLRLADGGEGRITPQGAPRVHLFAGPHPREELDIAGFGPPPF